MRPFSPALALLIAAALAAPAAAQSQELYALGRFNRIWRFDGFEGPAPTAVQVATWSQAGQAAEPQGLEIDPATGDFLVLVGNWSVSSVSPDAELLRVDAATGFTTLMFSLPYKRLSGLERRWDGKLVTIEDKRKVVVIDPADGSIVEHELSTPVLSSFETFTSFDIAPSGDLLMLSETPQVVESSTCDVQMGGLPAAPRSFTSVAVANDGTAYAGDVIPGNIHRFDPVTSQWQLAFAQGLSTTINIYDLALTGPSDGEGFGLVCEGLPNTTGGRATLTMYGSSEAASNDLELVARRLPDQTVGMFVMGRASGSIPVDSGVLCIDPTVFRYGASIAPILGGTYSFRADLPSLPDGTGAPIGETRIFQLWYRDVDAGVSTSNLSGAVSVTFH